MAGEASASGSKMSMTAKIIIAVVIIIVISVIVYFVYQNQTTNADGTKKVTDKKETDKMAA